MPSVEHTSLQMKSRKKIAKAFRQYNLLVTLFSFAIVGIVYLTTEYIEFTQNSQSYRVEKLNEQKAIIHNEVDKAIKIIAFHHSTFFATVCKNMRSAVSAGKNEGLETTNKSSIKLVTPCSAGVIACPRSVFYFQSRNLAQILGTKFIAIDTFPQTVGQVSSALHKYGEVFVFQYDTMPDNRLPNIRITYLRKQPKLDKIIGTSASWTNLNSVWTKETLDELSLIRFGKNGEGYIFVNTYSGDPLLTNGNVTMGNPNLWNLEDPKGNKVIQMEYTACQKPQGDYIFYSWRKVSPPGQKVYSVDSLIYPKVSFVKGMPQLKWMVGAGVYLDELEAESARNEAQLFKSYLISLVYFFALLLFSLVFSYLLAYRFSKQLARSTQRLIKFMQTIATNPSTDTTVELNFLEFQNIATIARELEDNRAQVETTFRQLVELYPDAITIMEDEVFTYINDAWLKHLGYTLEDVPALSDWFLQAYRQEDYRQEIRERWITFFATDPLDGKSMEEMWVTCKNGENKYFVARIIKPLKNRLMVVLTDITEIRNHEMELVMAKKRAEASDKLKSAFLANMSHEIRTPMNAIVGFSSLLQKTSITEERKEKYIKLIQSSTNSLLTLINDIIDISKLESGQIRIVREKTDVPKVLAEVYAIHKVLFEAKDHENLKLTLSCSGPLSIKVDPQRLRQILVNLIHNAYKFTDEGRVDFGFLPLDAGSSIVTFYCSDTGCGISPERSNKIFERFTSYGSSSEKVNSGTGLGLAISKNLIELMGGKIWFESEEGKGTTFYFTLPMDD